MTREKKQNLNLNLNLNLNPIWNIFDRQRRRLICGLNYESLLDDYYQTEYRRFNYTGLKGFAIHIHLDSLLDPKTNDPLRYPETLSYPLVSTYLQDLRRKNHLSPIVVVKVNHGHYCDGDIPEILQGLNGSIIVNNSNHEQIIQYNLLDNEGFTIDHQKLYFLYLDRSREPDLYDSLVKDEVDRLGLI